MPARCRFRIAVAACCLAVAWAPFVSAQDAVTLHNGDRLSGHAVALTEDGLVLETEYAGDVVIARDAIAAVETAGEVAWVDADGRAGWGRLTLRDGAIVALDADEAAAEWNELVALSPDRAPEELAVEYTEAVEAEMEDIGPSWSGAAETGVSLRSGPVDSIDTTVSVEGARETERSILSLRASGAYGEVDDVLNTQQASGRAKLQLFPRDDFYYYGLVKAAHDRPRRLDLRTGVGLGLGYEVIDRERAFWALEAGMAVDWEWWSVYAPRERREQRRAEQAGAFADARALLVDARGRGGAFRIDDLVAGTRIARRLLFADVDDGSFRRDDVSVQLGSVFRRDLFTESELYHELSVLPRLGDRLGEFLLTSDLGLTAPLTESLSLRVSLLTEYDSDPGSSADKWDNTLRTTMRYTF